DVVNVPVVTGLSPIAGPYAGGNTVGITGAGFDAVSSVRFGPTDVSSFVVDSPTHITAVAPPHSAGAVNVRVANAAGRSATKAANKYTYAQDVVTSIAVTSSANPAALGSNVAYKVTVARVDGVPLPTGTVTVSANGAPLGTAPLSAGWALVKSNVLPSGSNSVTASYS